MESSPPQRLSAIRGFPAGTHRLSASTGAVGAILLAVSIAILGTNTPKYHDSPQDFARFFANKTSTIELSLLLTVFGAVALIWFVGFLRWSFGAAEQVARGYQRAAPTAYGAAVAGIALALVYTGANEAAVVSQGVSSPDIVRALALFGVYALTSAAVLLSAFLLASFFLISVTRVLPQWLGIVAMLGTVLGAVQAFLLVAPQNQNGVLGALGYAWFIVFLIWTVGASVVLVLRTS